MPKNAKDQEQESVSKKRGRPSKITSPVLRKLEYAFEMGASDKEACSYAKIAPSTLYKYQEENPEFSEWKEVLKETVIFKARKEMVQGFKGNPDLALRFLERKRKDEFSLRKEVTGKDGDAIAIKFQGMTTKELEEEVERMRCKLKKT